MFKQYSFFFFLLIDRSYSLFYISIDRFYSITFRSFLFFFITWIIIIFSINHWFLLNNSSWSYFWLIKLTCHWHYFFILTNVFHKNWYQKIKTKKNNNKIFKQKILIHSFIIFLLHIYIIIKNKYYYWVNYYIFTVISSFVKNMVPTTGCYSTIVGGSGCGCM